MFSLYSILFLAALAVAVIVCLRRPFAGLMLLACASPFYTLLREASAGSGVFFIWPYLLMAVLVGVMVWNEALAALGARGVARPRLLIAAVAGLAMAAAALLLEVESRAISTFIGDTSLRGMGRVLDSRGFVALGFAGIAVLAGAMALFLAAIRRREGRIAVLDWAVTAFLAFGLVTIFVTYAASGILFTGLNGYRYYYVGALVYLPARYFMTTRGQERAFVRVVLAVVAIGAVEMLAESYALNVAGLAPQNLPWMGHLAREFGFIPESDRGFFDGRYVPMGFMYMTHMSGLFLVLGYALAVPRALASPRARFAMAVAGLAIIGACWTSRTVLLILVGVYILAALLMPVGWKRRAGGLAAVLLLIVLTSRFLLPGVRYDIAGEAKFLSTSAVPNLLGAIVVDLVQITGLDLGPKRRAWTPEGWLVPTKMDIERETVSEEPHRYVLKATTGETEEDLRYTLPAWFAIPGEHVVADVVLRSFNSRRLDLQLFQGDRLATSRPYPPGRGDWHTLTADFAVDASDAGALSLDVNVGAHSAVDVRSVVFKNSRGRLEALGWEHVNWLPHGWSASVGLSTGHVEHGGVPLVKITAPTGEGDFRYLVPAALVARGGPITVAAHVRAEVPGVRLQLTEGDTVVRNVDHPGTGWATLRATLARPSGRSVAIDISVLRGEAYVEYVSIETPEVLAGLAGDALPSLLALLPELAAALPPSVLPPAHGAEMPGAPPVPVSPPAPAPADPARTVPAGRAWTAPPAFATLFGRGAEFGMWNQVFFAESGEGQFAAASYSDMKYLEFAQQFGLLGLAALVWLALAAVWQPWRLALRASTLDERVLLVGVLLIMVTAFVSLAHLPSLFRLGFNTVTFIALAMPARRAPGGRAPE